MIPGNSSEAALHVRVSALSKVLGTGRLGRAVDRRRVLLSALLGPDATLAAQANGELAVVSHRIPTIYAAITLSVIGALLVCMTIAVGFLAVLIGTHLARIVAVLFALAMLSLIVALALFLREMYLAVNTVSSPVR